MQYVSNAARQYSSGDIRGVILAAICCPGCPPGHFKSQFCVLLRPPLYNAACLPLRSVSMQCVTHCSASLLCYICLLFYFVAVRCAANGKYWRIFPSRRVICWSSGRFCALSAK